MDIIEKIINYTDRLTLLYVEDNKEARENTLLIFEEFFSNILVAHDGQEGLKYFKENENIDIIITDVNMPNLNGLDMTKMIREIDKNIPILILSAYNESNFFIDSIKLDVEGYLLKPINFEQFLTVLGKIVENMILKEEASKNIELLSKYKDVTEFVDLINSYSTALAIFIKIENYEEIIKEGDEKIIENIKNRLENILSTILSDNTKDDKLISLGNGEFGIVKELSDDYEKTMNGYKEKLENFADKINNLSIQTDNKNFHIVINTNLTVMEKII